MRIDISVELTPNEYPLAAELLKTLHSLTEHVKVKVGAGGGAPLTPQIAQPIRPVPVLQPVVAAPATQPAGPRSAEEARRTFCGLLARLTAPAQLEPVAAELCRILGSPTLPLAALQAEFVEAFSSTVFQPKFVAEEQSVAPFLAVLPRLPEAAREGKEGIKAKVIGKVLGHINLKRPVTTGREEFYLQAEAFAVLVQMEFVAIEGAVQTLEKLLRNSEKRAAAMTTLGKTVERCRDKLAGVSRERLDSLFAVLDGVAEQQFQYDITWINNNMGRTRQQPPAAPPVQQPAAAPALRPAPPNARMAIASSFRSPQGLPTSTYFSLVYDPISQALISGGRDVPVTIWSQDGQVQHTIDNSGLYVCCIDVDLPSQLILLCGIFDPPAAQKARISLYDGRAGASYLPRGEIMRPDVDMAAVVRALPGTGHLITGESVRTSTGAFSEQVSLYDVNRVAPPRSGAVVEPLQVFSDHSSLVTCLAPIGASNPGVFVSGSRDFTVKLWDMRSGSKAVATLGVAAGNITSCTHGEMVTCVDVRDQLVVSGSLDQSLAAWDLRTMGAGGSIQPFAVATYNSLCNQHGKQAQWANAGILKASLDGTPFDKLCAVATVSGLYIVDLSTAAPIISQASAFAADGATPKQYNDIKWAAGSGRLFASAGDGAVVDVLELRV